MKSRNRAQRPGKQSLFRRYYVFCSACVISSITILGVVLLVFCTSYFESDKYRSMERNANVAAAVTAANYRMNRDGSVSSGVVNQVFNALSTVIEGEFFLTDLNGNVLLSQTSRDFRYENVIIAENIMSEVAANRVYEGTGNLNGLYDTPHYTVGVPVLASDEVPIAAVFVSTDASDLFGFLAEITKMFLASAVVVLVVASVAISFITGRLVRPLNLMLQATQSFSRGDFSKRVPVSGYDEIGQLSMAFNNMASTLAATESSRRSFIANVSHELKTPMTTIGGFVDGILDGTVPEAKRDQYLQVVSTEVKRLSRLVRSMLDTARIEAGEMQVNRVEFDISEIIRQTIFTFERNIEEKELEIRGLEEDHVMVYADRDLMHQVVYNLLENAVKFVNQGGYIEVGYLSDASGVHVAIRNSGEGIDKVEVTQLFDRFYKSDKSRSQNKSGVGLGLHIARTIIQYHKGEIKAHSVEGEYTEFVFRIPHQKT